MLNAFTTCALAGTALAISCAPEEPSGVTSGGDGGSGKFESNRLGTRRMQFEPFFPQRDHESAHRQLNQIAQHEGVACLDQAPAFIKTTEFYC